MVFKELLIDLFDGKQFSRQIAITEVRRHHCENGGVDCEGKRAIGVYKAAVRSLKKSGDIDNIAVGIWRLSYKVKDIEVLKTPEKSNFIIESDKSIGEGKSSVYVYYYDSYKELSQLKKQPYWQCKIGRTDVDPLQRIMGQVGTCYPELPHIALVIYCENSAILESAIHSILKYKGRHLKSAPGTEWFMTTPEEIEDIYNGLNQ